MTSSFSRLRNFTRGAIARTLGLRPSTARESDFARELESHLQLHIDDNVRAGMSPGEARRKALIALGGVEQTKEAHREQRGIPMIETLLRDLRYGARGLRKSPTFAVAAVLILGLGIGVNTAIFTVINAVLLRPLPFPEADRIMRIWHTPPSQLFVGQKIFTISPANFLDWEAQSRSFEFMAVYGINRQTLTGQSEAESIIAGEASAALFPILGLKPVLGRVFTKEEDRDGSPRVTVLTETLWRNRFGADPNILGRVLTMNGEGVTVVGVVPQATAVVDRPQMWMPLAWDAEKRAVRANHNYLGMAKLKPGVTVAQAQTDLTTISQRLEQQYPAENKDWGALVLPMQDDLVGEARSSLLLLLGAVGLVLLIACANLANLLLVRTHGRAKEIAVRTALGAGRGRIITQLLTEGLLLGIGGGVAGLCASYLGVRSLVSAFGTALPRAAEVAPDARVLIFTGFVAMIAGLLAAAIPAWQLTQRDATEVLKRGSGRGNSSAGDGRVRNLLVVSEVALALMLLVGAGLLMKSLAGLRSVDAGFDAHNLLTMTIDVPRAKYPGETQMNGFFEAALDQVRSVPGVVAAAGIDNVPLRGGSSQPVSTENTTGKQQSELPIVAVRFATPGYFAAIKIPFSAGRDFERTDTPAGRRVAIVSELAAARLWPNENAIGKQFTLGLMSEEDSYEVTGIVHDVRMGQLDETDTEPAVYIAIGQLKIPPAFKSLQLTLIARTSVAPDSVSRAIVSKVRGLDPDQPVQNIMEMAMVVERSLGQRPFAMMLLAAFAGLALVLATIGIYSVIAYSVGQRLREIGIRLALGAPARTVLKMVVVEGLKPTLVGLGVGLTLSAFLVRLMTSQLYGVSAYDPGTFGIVATVVVTVGVLATLIPAYRATRVDPMVTLRAE